VLRIDILTLFPQWFEGPLTESILARAREQGVLSLKLWNFRDYATDRHKVVDDTPYGGGAGMVLKPDPLSNALDAIAGPPGLPGRPRVILTSPQGPPFTQNKAKELAALERFVLVCGRYEGVDERVIESRIDEELSIGDFVLTGGELPAMIIVDAVARMVEGVLGNPESALFDSFYSGLFDCPHYTRPEVFEGRRVPEILLTGHHARIEAWRRIQGLLKTARVRPDLVDAHPEARDEIRRILEKHADSVPEVDSLFDRWPDLRPQPKPKRRKKKKSAEEPTTPPPGE
jgi:tRNA (guanine37-N1)-methyltransferase